MLDAPLLVLVDLETAESAPTGPSLELLTAARSLTGGDVIALALQPLGEPACAALAGAGATRLLTAEPLEVPVSAEAAAVRLVSREATSVASGPALTEARTVVVGGRGVDGDFDLVRSLAEPLGAAVGATRVACDEGWAPRGEQIGQTGLSVSPNLYVGLGVSGAVHHTVGMQSSAHIVAVCDDPDAPIFELADFGVVGDVAEVVPQALDEIRKARAAE